jgi:hypothetical protein
MTFDPKRVITTVIIAYEVYVAILGLRNASGTVE